jgi:signal transduction protein with GAF and PtsI domain
MNDKSERKIQLREFKAISRAILTFSDVNLLINHIVERICRSFSVKGCSIMLFDDHKKQLFRVASHGVSEEYLNKGPLLIDKKYAAFVTGVPVFIENFQNDRRVQYPEAAAKEGIVSMLSIPIKFRDISIGLIRIYHNEVWQIHDDDMDSFCLLAVQLGLVIENSGLHKFFEKVKEAIEILPLPLLKGLHNQ